MADEKNCLAKISAQQLSPPPSMDYGDGKTFDSYQPQGGGWSASQGDGGGGFMSQVPASQANDSPGVGKKKKFESQSLLAVTIKQLNTATQRESKFVIDNKEISQVTFVGHVISMEMQSTNINYMIDDGTGKITVRQYIDAEDQDPQQLREDQYVRVVGNIRALGGAMSVVAFQLSAIRDYNEITFHMLEAIHGHLYNTRGPIAGGAPATSAPAMQVKSEPSSSYAQGQVISMGSGLENSNIDSVQQAVLKVFSDNASDDQGQSFTFVCSKLTNISQQKIREAVEFLCNEGLLYSTIDEEHFRCTAAD
eukprot:g24462.t1